MQMPYIRVIIKNKDFSKIIELATKKFTDACYDQGLSVEKTKQLLYSKQGLDLIAKTAADLI